MVKIIEDSLKKAYSYIEYKKLILEMLKEGKSTGIIQNEDLYNFSKLNDKRMKRLDKQTKLTENTKRSIDKIQKDFTWLVLTESWCGDAAQSLPIINKIAESNPKINLKLVLRDENEELMNNFLTRGSKSIPKIIVLDKESNKVLSSWGPRSKTASNMVRDYIEKNGKMDADFKKQLQIWYNNDKGNKIEKEIVELINNIK